ncbi:hypothetical protein Efla_007183 [Eimeria flavescens]
MRAVHTLRALARKQTAAPAAACVTAKFSISASSSAITELSVSSAFRQLHSISSVPFQQHACSKSVSASPLKFTRRSFASEAASDSPSSSVSFAPEEVSRRLVELAQKYCKGGSEVSASHSFESLQTREDRPWDCLDTVEFVLDAEDIFGIVIPDEAADAFEKIQDVVDYIVSTSRKEGVASSA